MPGVARRLAGGGDTESPCLARDEIHVWTVAIDGRIDAGEERMETLAQAERMRASRFMQEADAARFVQRRRALRAILGRYLGIAPQEVAFAANEFGKPSVLPSRTCDDLSFNASHSGAIALVAVGRSVAIGIDIERMRAEVEGLAIATRFFGANEVAALAGLAPDDRVAGFFNAWTRKEAVVKAVGGGLSIPLDSFEVSLRPREPPSVLRWHSASGGAKPWRIHHLEPAAGYVGALAVDDPTRGCRFLDWVE